MRHIILASASPRRKELMKLIDSDFSIVVSDADEITDKIIPWEAAEELSCKKAEAVYGIIQEKHGNNIDIDNGDEYILVGADTIVAADGMILGKPADSGDACRMLGILQGGAHEVYTGVTIIKTDGKSRFIKTFHECTRVYFYPMTEEEIQAYVATGDPLDKAGAYGIQSGAAVYIEKIEGDYNNVVGLPVARLYHELERI